MLARGRTNRQSWLFPQESEKGAIDAYGANVHGRIRRLKFELGAGSIGDGSASLLRLGRMGEDVDSLQFKRSLERFPVLGSFAVDLGFVTYQE